MANLYLMPSVHLDLDNMSNDALADLLVELHLEMGRRQAMNTVVMNRLVQVTSVSDLGIIIRAWLRAAVDNKVSIPGYNPNLDVSRPLVTPQTRLNEVERMMVEGPTGMIPAIKMFRERTCAGLKEAKDECDVWRAYARAKRLALIEEALAQRILPG